MLEAPDQTNVPVDQAPDQTSAPEAKELKHASSSSDIDENPNSTLDPHVVEMEKNAPSSPKITTITYNKKAVITAAIVLFVGVLCIILFAGVRIQDTNNDDTNKSGDGGDVDGTTFEECTKDGMTVRDPKLACICWTPDLWKCSPPAQNETSTPEPITNLLALSLPEFDDCMLVAFDIDQGMLPSWTCDGTNTLVNPHGNSPDQFIQSWEWLESMLRIETTCLRQRESEIQSCVDPDDGIVAGRPLYDKLGHTLLANLVPVALLTGSGDEWVAPVINTETMNVTGDKASCEESERLTSDERARLVHMWEQAARYEHASVASFSKFSLQLMAVGAPPALVLGAHVAAIEEIGHAKLCLQVAQAITATAGTDLVARHSIGQLPVPHSLEISITTSELAYSTAIEGAVGETFAAFYAAVAHHEALLALRTADDTNAVALTQVVDSLSIIMREEGSHAALAWRTLDWAIDHPVKGESQQQVIRSIQQAFNEQHVEVDRKFHTSGQMTYGQMKDVINQPVMGWGHVSKQRRSELDRVVFNEVIKVLFSALMNRSMKDFSFIPRLLQEAGAESVVKVLNHIAELLKQDE